MPRTGKSRASESLDQIEKTSRYESRSVRQLFDDMASTYGHVNLITSFGFTVRWRNQVLSSLPLDSAACVVDLMSGMGELWRSLAPRLTSSARLIGIDFSSQMTRRARRGWPFAVEVQVADVLELDGRAMQADIVVSSFGLKTLSRAQQAQLARQVAAMLKPGGAYAFIEISVPPSRLLRPAYMFYLKRVIPLVGRLLPGNPDCYRMLGIYTEEFGNTSYFASCLRQVGLEAQETSHFFGCATGVRGVRPANMRGDIAADSVASGREPHRHDTGETQ